MIRCRYYNFLFCFSLCPQCTQKKIHEVIGSLAEALSILEGGTKSEISRERQQQTTPIEQDETSQMVKTLSRTIIDLNEMLKATISHDDLHFISFNEGNLQYAQQSILNQQGVQ